MKKTLLFFMAGVFLFGSCGEPEITEVSSLQVQQKPSVTFPEIIDSRNRSSSGRTEDQLVDALNGTLFANTNYRVSEVHVCRLRAADAATSVTTLDQQFESTLPSRWVTNDVRRNWNGDNDLNDLDWLPFTPLAVANGTFNATPTYQSMYSKWETP